MANENPQPQTKVEQKAAEEVLRQVQLIVDNSHDAIIGETLDGTITTWNGGAETMFGYAAEEVVGSSVLFLLPPEIKDEMPALLNKVRTGKVIADYDSVRVRKDGTKIDVAMSISPVKTETGAIIGASVVERDISERKKQERHIKELDETRNKFITIISHQLRTPLTAVNWNLETLLNGDFGPLEETQRKFLQVTHRASVEITNRIHNLLTAMDVEEGRVRYEKGDVALDGLCAGVVNEMRKACELKNISCTYVPPVTDLPSIEGDADRIRRAVAIMVENAIGYTKEGGTVALKLTKEGTLARIEVTDTGIGIPEAEQHHIFTRFFRASNASVMQPDAFGLGLFLAKSFVSEHGGTIGFTSLEGKGSAFWIELPISLS